MTKYCAWREATDSLLEKEGSFERFKEEHIELANTCYWCDGRKKYCDRFFIRGSLSGEYQHKRRLPDTGYYEEVLEELSVVDSV